MENDYEGGGFDAAGAGPTPRFAPAGGLERLVEEERRRGSTLSAEDYDGNNGPGHGDNGGGALQVSTADLTPPMVANLNFVSIDPKYFE